MSELYPSTLQPPSMRRIVPSRITCGVDRAVGQGASTRRPARRRRPGSRGGAWAWPTSPAKSSCVMPSFEPGEGGLVGLQRDRCARRISSISCASFTIRHPAVTGVPLTIARAGRGLATPSRRRSRSSPRCRGGRPPCRGPSGPARPARTGPRPRARCERRRRCRRTALRRAAPARGPPRTPGRRRTASPLAGRNIRNSRSLLPPADVAEVDERRAAHHRDRIQPVLGHQPARPLHPVEPFPVRDRSGQPAHGLQCRDRRRHWDG